MQLDDPIPDEVAVYRDLFEYQICSWFFVVILCVVVILLQYKPIKPISI